jgi:glucose-6-phosphate isomerase
MVDMPIHFDEINLSAGMVGAASGLTHSEIKQHTAKALDSLRSFRKSSESGLYGFPLLPFQAQFAKEILAYADQMRGSYDTVCLAGIGGSALGSWALDCGIRGPHPVQGAFSASHPRLVILDNVDPSLAEAALDSMNPK